MDLVSVVCQICDFLLMELDSEMSMLISRL